MIDVARSALVLAFLFAAQGRGIVKASAAEYCPDAQSEIQTDRPDVTNSSYVVPTGSLQAENGINITAHRGSRSIDGTNTRIRLGVAHCTELLVDLPDYFHSVHDGGPDWVFGRYARSQGAAWTAARRCCFLRDSRAGLPDRGEPDLGSGL